MANVHAAAPPIRDLSGAVLRANPAYEPVLFDRLPEAQRGQLGRLGDDPELYGLLRPHDSAAGLGTKSLDRETALLFFTLGEPGPLPTYARRLLGGGADHKIAELVLGEVLQLAVDTLSETFVGGASALAHLRPGESPDLSDTPGLAASERTTRLSIEALRHAQAFDLDEAGLAAKLYTYHRLPRSPRWQRRLPDRGSLLAFLGLQRGSELRRRLDVGWVRAQGASLEDPWISWNPRQLVAKLDGELHKLYVSPLPEHLPQALAAVVDVLEGLGPESFKIGADADNVLRPDKLVVYVQNFDRVAELAEALRERLDGCPAQGVPFTAGLGDDGLISWGVDPPPGGATVPWLERESWRLRVVNRLAVALSAARRQTDGPEPWRYALERLSYEGINTATWSPLGGDRVEPASLTYEPRSLK